MSKKSTTRNDNCWDILFDRHDILNKVNNHGRCYINASEINVEREARLMTKFDHKVNLPTLFQKNNLSILPITRGSYIISHFQGYQEFEELTDELTKIPAPSFIRSIDFMNITSEATAINVAYITGMLADFVEDDTLLPTVNGRMSSGCFAFNIKNKSNSQFINVTVKNSQIEIDGGFEGMNSLTLIEAKNSISDDFLIRQLYYPYRLWHSKLQKEIKPVFLTYSNGVFRLYEYLFQDPNNYNSLVLIKQKNYSLAHDSISYNELDTICKQVTLLEEPQNIPFPQADNFNRVVNICELLYENDYLTQEAITSNYDFDVRQTNYYTDACRYLGLATKEHDQHEGIKYSLTEKGKDLFSLSLKYRNLKFAECILEKKVFNESFKRTKGEKDTISRNTLVDIMKNSALNNISADSTYKRRASTVNSWLNWILDLVKK